MTRFKTLVLTLFVTLFVAVGSGLLLASTPSSPQPAMAVSAFEDGPGTVALSAYGDATSASPVAVAALDTWPHLRHDSGHTGYNADVGSFRPPLVPFDATPIYLQNVLNGSGQIFNLVAGPDRIFAGGQFVIWGVNKQTPSEQWVNDDCVPDQTGNFCMYSYLGYTAGRLVVARQTQTILTVPPFLQVNYELAVLDAANGQEIWSRDVGSTPPEVALDGSDILVLFESTSGGQLLKLSLVGSQMFRKAAEFNSSADGKAVTGGGKFIYAEDDIIRAYNSGDGTPSWVYTPAVPANTYGYDLVATDDAVIVSYDERVIKLDIIDGTEAWKEDLAPPACGSDLGPNGAATDGSIIAITAVCDREIVALHYGSGIEAWRKGLGQVSSASAIAIGGDVLYTAAVVTSTIALTPTVYALNPVTGSELDRLALGSSENSSVLAISDGLLLTASNVGTRRLQRFQREPADVAATLSTATLPVCGAPVGVTVQFAFQATNLGPGSTDNARAELALPDGSATVVASQGSCSSGPTPACDLGPLANGQTAHITATVTLSAAGGFSPGISVSSDVNDPNDLNDSASTSLTVDPAVPANLDLQLSDIEVTQGVQNLANDILMVQGKTTFVRLYGQTNGGTVRNVSAILHGERNVTGEDLGTLTPINQTACLTLDDSPDRDRLRDSFVFQLPDDWVEAGVRFTAEIDPGGFIPETDTGNNTLDHFEPFIPYPRICLKTYPVRTSGNGSDNLRPHFQSILRDDGNILSRALTMLPTREIKVFPSSHLIEEWEPFAAGGWGPYEMEKDEDNRGDVLDTLWWINLFTDDPDECDDEGARTHYVGMVDEDTDNSVGSAGLGIRDGDELMLFLNTGPNGPRAFDDPHGGLTLAHEIGHNYDRGHVDCRDPENPDGNYPYDPCQFAPVNPRGFYGLEFRDPTSPVVITPTMAGDVMSYAADVWPSDYTWRAIQGVLCDAIDCLSAPLNAGISSSVVVTPSITGDVLLLRGWTSPTLALQQMYRLPASQVPKADERWAEQIASRPVTPIYHLKLMAGGTLLHSEPFTPTESSDQQGSRASFGLVVPWITGTNRIDVTANGSTVISRTVSPSPPAITAISPNGGESFTDTLPISWTAGDPDGDALRYSVLFSGDGGASWQALATGVETTTLAIDASSLPGTAGMGLVKVIASDGLNFATRQSASGFSLPDRSPSPAIYFPDDGGEYASGSSLTLRGAAYDPEDSYLPPSALSWTLSGVGSLGTGESVELSGLADGDYTLTLTAVDSLSQTSSDSITFRIGGAKVLYLPVIIRE